MPEATLNVVTVIGYLAALCSMVSFAPQAVKVIRSGDTQSISLATYCVTVTGFALWLAFGFLKGEWPIIVSNFVCLLLSGFILVMKIIPQNEKDAVCDAVNGD